MATTTNFKNSSGDDIGFPLVEKSYLIDRYPELADTFKQAGLWLWGLGTSGQLGDNTIVNKSSPVQTVAGGTNWKQASCFSLTCGAIKTDGTLWTWGFNDNGALGNNITTTRQSSPVQTVAGGTNWKQISGGDQNFAAIKTDGTLWLWGWGTQGQLGNNDQNSKSSPVQTVAAGTNWKQVSINDYTTAAIKTDGTLWIWGDSNLYGQLGNNTVGSNKSSPIQTIAGGTNWKQVVAGITVKAIKTDGTLWLWGAGDNGQLGDNTTTAVNTGRSSPVQTISGGTNWKQVAGQYTSVAAIKTDGTLWTWGANGNGQLGDNTATSKSSPVQTISGGTNWKQVDMRSTTAAIKTDGTLWLWGLNTSGQLGDNTLVSRAYPVQTVTGGTNWKQVVIGATTTTAIRDDSADVFGDPT